MRRSQADELRDFEVHALRTMRNKLWSGGEWYCAASYAGHSTRGLVITRHAHVYLNAAEGVIG